MNRGVGLVFGFVLAVSALLGNMDARALTPSVNFDPTLAVQGRNSISGFVFSESRRPMADIYVELLDEFGVSIRRTRTEGSGRYSFVGLGDGRYKVKVLPYGTDYTEQVRDVSLLPLSAVPGAGAESVQVDFYLRLREGVDAGPFYAPASVFVQEVPEEARRLYEKGLVELREKKEAEGFQSLRRSLEIFPDYYLALNRLGTEYAVRGNLESRYFEAASILLTKAVEVNPRSFSSNFGLGFSQYHLGRTDEAIESLRRAASIYNKSVNNHLWLGIALKRAGKLQQAEAALKRADELSDGKEADVHWQLAGLYGEQNRYREAAAELELFLKHKPNARDAEKIRQLIAQLKEKADAAP